jgi:sortase A
MRNKPYRIVEGLLLATGVTLLVVVAAALLYRSILSRVALMQFDHAQAASVQQEHAGRTVEAQSREGVDVRLWSPKRILDYRESLFRKIDPPLAILRLDRLRIRVPVFEGTSDLVLNRGAGWIVGTARPGAAGNSNIGIAGHRDGFFRGFKDILVGDAVVLSTPGLVSDYTVAAVEIVDPEDVAVLQPSGVPSLTLVTCYPFYFLGDAPKRFIVHATLKRQVGIQKLQNRGSAFARTAQTDSKGERR